jgi:hypothetical protein
MSTFTSFRPLHQQQQTRRFAGQKGVSWTQSGHDARRNREGQSGAATSGWRPTNRHSGGTHAATTMSLRPRLSEKPEIVASSSSKPKLEPRAAHQCRSADDRRGLGTASLCATRTVASWLVLLNGSVVGADGGDGHWYLAVSVPGGINWVEAQLRAVARAAAGLSRPSHQNDFCYRSCNGQTRAKLSRGGCNFNR